MIVSDAALLDVPGGPEEPLGRVEGDRVDAAGQGPAARREGQVVGPGEAGDRVEQDHDVAAGLDLALGDLEGHLGDVGVVLGRLVERRADDLALDAPAHVGDLFRPLADEGDHEEDLRVVGGDAVGDVLEEHRLAGLRRADDEGALALADRVHEVDEPLAQVLGVGLEVDEHVGMDRGQVAEDRPPRGRESMSTPLTESTRRRPQYFSASRGARTAPATRSPMRRPKRRTWLERDVDVLRARQEAVAAHEAEAFVDDVEDAAGEVEAGPFRLALEDAVGDVVAALLGARLELEVAGDLPELGDAHLAQVGDLEVVPVAGGLDLLLLVVLRHRAPDGALGAAGRVRRR